MEVIFVFAVKVFVDVLGWQSMNDVEEVASVDVCDVGQNHGELHDEVGEIWIENF